MAEIELTGLEDRLGDLSYPISREDAANELDDTTLHLADGEVNLGGAVAQSSDDRFTSVEDLASEVRGLLPREAVGEPYQSEGEG